MADGYYLTAEPVGICSCHDCTCAGMCPECIAQREEEDGDDDETC